MTDHGIPERQIILTLQVAVDDAEALHEELAGMDLFAVELAKPGSPVCWLEIYFPGDTEAMLVEKSLEGGFENPGNRQKGVTQERLESSVKHHFSRMVIGDRLEVCPIWENEDAPASELVRVLINPGLSFGTGNHFTTRFCLEMLTRILGEDKKVDSFLDLGTGSGILAISAVKLGVSSAIGVEHDALALEQTRENLVLNDVESSVELREQDLLRNPVQGVFDMVFANIYTAALLEMADWLPRTVGRHLVLTGIREMEADAVADVYMQAGGTEVVRDGDGEWAGIYFTWKD